MARFIGDLVFKLNPSPVRSQLHNGSCSIVSRQWQSDTTTALPNAGNPMAAIVSQRPYQELRADRDTRNLIEIRPSRMDIRLHQQMLLCNLNARSVRNDSICLSSADRNLVPPEGEALDITDEVLRSFGNLSERNVCELIKASAKKSYVLDPFPTNVVCDSLDVLLPLITNMVNASLSTGHFPDNWKEAIIKPFVQEGRY